MDSKNILKANKWFLLAALISSVVTILYIIFTGAYLQEKGALDILYTLNSLTPGRIDSSGFSITAIKLLPLQIIGLFSANKMVAINWIASWIFVPVLLLFASYKLAAKSKKYIFFVFQLSLYSLFVFQSSAFLANSVYNTQIISLFLFLLLIQYLNSDIDYSLKDYICIGLLLGSQFLSAIGWCILPCLVYSVSIWVYYAFVRDNKINAINLVSSSVMFLSSVFNFFFDFNYRNWFYKDYADILQGQFSGAFFQESALFLLSLILIVYAMFFVRNTFKKKHFLIFALLYLVLFVHFIINPTERMLFSDSDTSFCINYLLPLVVSLFAVCVPYFTFFECLNDKISNKFIGSFNLRNFFIENKDKVVIALLIFNSLFYLLSGVLVFLKNKFVFELIFSSLILFLLSSYMLFDFLQVSKLNDKNEKIEYLKGSIKTLIIFFLYFLFSCFFSVDSYSLAINISYSLVLVLTCVILGSYLKFITQQDNQDGQNNQEEQEESSVLKNIISVTCVEIVCISLFLCFATASWSNEFDLIKSKLSNSTTALYVKKQNDWVENKYYFNEAILDLPLSIVLSKDYEVKKVVIMHNPDEENKFPLNETYTFDDRIYMPWQTIDLKNKYWDLNYIWSEIDKYKQEHGI
ncbi:MAG: hypothetical protein ACI37Z_07190 [Candidatus Gastranaerophilaceae bacterium]